MALWEDVVRIVSHPVDSFNSFVRSAKAVDRPFFFLTLALLVIGMVALTSASSVLGEQRFGNSYHFVLEQLGAGVLFGLFLSLFVWLLPKDRWQQLAMPCMAVSLFLLILVFVPGMGVSLKGAHRWIDLGLFVFQPTEVVKFCLVIYLAAWLVRLRDNAEDLEKTLLPFAIFFSAIAGLVIFQPDIGTLGALAAIAIGMYWLAGGKKIHVAAIVFAGMIAVVILAKLAPYRLARVQVFLNPETDPQGIGYHLAQAETAISNGGIWGQGLGNSTQKFLRLPETAGDSIFAVIAEEFGFILTVLLVGLFAFWLWRAWQLAMRVPDEHGRLLAGGIVTWFGYQIAVNIMAMTGLFPLTGIPLPFFSHGGTAYAVNLAAIALLMRLSVSDHEALRR